MFLHLASSLKLFGQGWEAQVDFQFVHTQPLGKSIAWRERLLQPASERPSKQHHTGLDSRPAAHASGWTGRVDPAWKDAPSVRASSGA
ncbi:hypothetical protein WJX74_004130 [Apatococcus lobatus]|uniref:Uncharacterized protein n=1 Tax=Apatococcus lobatus TaxID=904363 RepID=A0AAW1QDP7_9CHLO